VPWPPSITSKEALASPREGATDSFPDGQDYPDGYPNPPDIDPDPETPYATLDGVYVDNPG
jgi:hypothetical protein